MKKIYEQPMTDVVSVELTQLMAISGDPEDGFSFGEAPTTNAESGNLSLDISDLWD